MSQAIISDSDLPRPLHKSLVGMYFLEAAAVLFLLSLYKAGDTTIITVLTTRLGYGIYAAATLFLVGVALLVHDRLSPPNTGMFTFTVALNIVSVLFLFALAEGALRIATSVYPDFSSIFPRGFLPKVWSEMAARNNSILSAGDRDFGNARPILEFHPVLGWKPGTSRTSENGLYVTSVEGIRSQTPDHSYRASPASRRIALVGDSYTFGVGVAFEDTWGHQLQGILGDEYQVLNFGVGGYGVDQSYLRYVEDARSWSPDIVVFGLISHDLFRSQVVYPFIAFPGWEIPFAKPRFVLEETGRLSLANVPLASPDQIFAASSIAELPFINLEPTYFPPDWRWRWYHYSHTLRFLVSVSPRWPAVDAHSANTRISLNSMIVRKFVESAILEGSSPVIAFFPSYGAGELDFGGNSGNQKVGRRVHETLAEANVDYLDLTSCLEDLPPSKGLASDGRHYSAEANRMVAHCLHGYLRQVHTARFEAE